MPALGCANAVAEFLREASEEMTEAAAFYEERREGLGERFLDIVEATVLRVDEAPLAGARWPLDDLPITVRRWPLSGFPFFVVYVLEPALVIVAIAHMSREPGYWRERLPRHG